MPNSKNTWDQLPPPGLIILKGFITADEEDRLVKCIDWSANADIEFNTNLRHRQVKHFGYEFLYGTNDVDVNKPLLDQKIPDECDVLWTRLAENKDLNIAWKKPEQLTVNKYEAGQGNKLYRILGICERVLNLAYQFYLLRHSVACGYAQCL